MLTLGVLAMKQNEVARRDFSDRLLESMRSNGIGESGTTLAGAYNLRNPDRPVTVHAARKWLIGGSIPTHDKVIRLADWLGVSPSWLRFGSIEAGATSGSPRAGGEASLLSDIAILTSDERSLIKALIEAILKARVAE